jgi:TPR repeat protein
MSSPDSINDIMITCAANKCKAVKYCNAACKKKHRKTHKKKCEIRAAELHEEEALFKEPPLPPEECPVCFLPLPHEQVYTTFKSCCGKLICNGCTYAMAIVAIKKGEREEAGNCPFCRGAEVDNVDTVTSVKSVKKLVENGNANAMKMLASYYRDGSYGLPRDFVKANELNLKAGELGCTAAYLNLGDAIDKVWAWEEIRKNQSTILNLPL